MKQNWIINRISRYLEIDEHDSLKVILAACTLFFVIGSYSILRSLKTSIFLGFVGREYEPIAKILSIVIMIPVMLLYANIVDRFKRHQAVCLFIGFYAILAFVFAYLFAHPVYGLANTQTDPYRIVGWAFEIFMDLFQALIVGSFWSFLTSISTPEFASKSYGLIVAGSRIGGILTTLCSWLLLEKTHIAGTVSIPLLTGATSIFLLLAAYCVYLIRHRIPSSHLHGYQAAYEAEIAKEKAHKKTGVFEGLRLMLTEPYVLGIFGLVFSFEVINIIFDYQMHVLMSIETNNQVHAMSSFMLFYTGTFQTLSLIFALFGTSKLVKHFGIQRCLLILPMLSIGLAILPILYPRLSMIFLVMVMLRATNYGFNRPLREMLFIPTIKDIQFKSKAWIDSFGRTFSKTTGSTINMIAILGAPYFCLLIESVFSIGLAIIWGLIALIVGRRYTKTIANNEVIGKQD